MSQRGISLRALVFALGFGGGLLFSPWVPLIAIIVLTVRYAAWEALLLGVILDLLWAPTLGDPSFTLLPVALPLYSIAALLLLWGLEPLRREFMNR